MRHWGPPVKLALSQPVLTPTHLWVCNRQLTLHNRWPTCLIFDLLIKHPAGVARRESADSVGQLYIGRVEEPYCMYEIGSIQKKEYL